VAVLDNISATFWYIFATSCILFKECYNQNRDGRKRYNYVTFFKAISRVPIPLPFIQPVLNALYIHQDYMPNSDMAEAARSEIDHLHRQFPPPSTLKGGGLLTNSTHDQSVPCTEFSINNKNPSYLLVRK